MKTKAYALGLIGVVAALSVLSGLLLIFMGG
jgi:hypothetical protein